MKDKQEQLKEMCKFLKWSKGIDYYKIAQSIGMSEHGFYNFINNPESKLGYTYTKELEKFIEENK